MTARLQRDWVRLLQPVNEAVPALVPVPLAPGLRCCLERMKCWPGSARRLRASSEVRSASVDAPCRELVVPRAYPRTIQVALCRLGLLAHDETICSLARCRMTCCRGHHGLDAGRDAGRLSARSALP